MGSWKVKAVVYEISVQNWRPQFTVPESVSTFLGLEHEEEAALVVRRYPSMEVAFEGIKRLKSGTEIYGAEDINKCLKPGERIEVEASRPPSAEVENSN